jgi:hypothetical protein
MENIKSVILFALLSCLAAYSEPTYACMARLHHNTRVFM